MLPTYCNLRTLGAMAEWVESRLPVWKVGSSNPGRVKSMTSHIMSQWGYLILGPSSLLIWRTWSNLAGHVVLLSLLLSVTLSWLKGINADINDAFWFVAPIDVCLQNVEEWLSWRWSNRRVDGKDI